MDFLFELDAPGAGPRPAQVPPTAPSIDRTATNALFELDAPGVGPRSATRADLGAPIEPTDPNRSTVDLLVDGDRPTMEFLFDLDTIGPSTSREIDLDTEPALAQALAAASARASTPEAASAVVAAEPEIAAPHVELPDLSVFALDAAPERAKGAEAQQQQRLPRTVLRVATCRDALRLMSTLGVQDAERANAARMLMDIDTLVGRAEGAPGVIKSPESALKNTTLEQLDAVDHALSAIEDKLLWLDESVSPEAFRLRVEGGKQTKKVLGRYARLLACRRFMAGQRRDRFEWIVTELLTTTDAQELHSVLPPERARSVLQHVIGQLPRKAKEQEVSEAIAYLQDALVRLESIRSHDEFFDSGFFLDVHGYKVSMRELLIVPEFLYLSVLINARVHNRLEHWITDRQRLHRLQVASESSARDDIMRLLREQEDAVDDIFSIKQRPAAPAPAPEGQKAAAAPAKTKAKSKSKTKKRAPRFEIVFDRQLFLLLGALVAIAGAASTVMFETGKLGAPAVHALSDDELQKISPIIARGWIRGEGKKAALKALVRSREWDALDARNRTAEADRIATLLAARGIRNAVIADRRGTKLVEIQDGLTAHVEGGKL